MFVTGLGTAVPPYRYTQRECWAAMQAAQQFRELTDRSHRILKKVLCGDNGIEHRYFVLKSLDEAFDLSPDSLHSRFLRHAPFLASEAAERALSDAGLRSDEIDGLTISTCTGYLCPGLSSYVAERLCLRSDVIALDLVGQGCGAAIPNWQAAEALIASKRCRRLLAICVEICSAAMYLDNDPGVLISTCLFGDGAGAMVLSDRPSDRGPLIKWRTSASVTCPEHRDLLRFEQRGGLLRNVLSREVPVSVGKYAEQVLHKVLASSDVPLHEITAWVLHSGGRDVLVSLEKRLALDPAALCWSRWVLREFGNLSSASVYFVLQAALKGRAPDGWWWVSSFGAGFSSHGALLWVSGNQREAIIPEG
jgi:polyketide synthase Type III